MPTIEERIAKLERTVSVMMSFFGFDDADVERRWREEMMSMVKAERKMTIESGAKFVEPDPVTTPKEAEDHAIKILQQYDIRCARCGEPQGICRCEGI